MDYTMARKDWGGLLDGTIRNHTNSAALERIGKLRWEGKTHADDDETLTIQLTDKEVSAITRNFAEGYLNTAETYEQVARIYNAFGFPVPGKRLPHDGGTVFKDAVPAATK